ncbi:MAG: hypothetical protein QW692_02040 [Nitrososphaerota archaeon]
MYEVRLILEGGKVEVRRFKTQSELGSFIRIADLSDVDLIIIKVEAPSELAGGEKLE